MFHEPPGADRQGGGGGSAPLIICLLHYPRGKRPMRPRSVKLVLAVGWARMVALPIACYSRVRQPDPVCPNRDLGHARGGAGDRVQSPVHALLPLAACRRSRTAGTTCFRGGLSIAMPGHQRGGPDTVCSEVSKRDEACRVTGLRGDGTELFMGWEGAMLLAPHQGWSRNRVQSTVGATTIAGQRPEPSRCEHNMVLRGGERCWGRKVHGLCSARNAAMGEGSRLRAAQPRRRHAGATRTSTRQKRSRAAVTRARPSCS